jgi:hypothetical protein
MAATVYGSISASNTTAATTLETASFTVGGANRVLYIAVAVGSGSPAVPSSVKWGGVSGTDATQIGTSITVNTYGNFDIWRLIAPAATTSTIYVTWSSAQDERYICAVAVQDADQTTPNGTVAQANANTSVLPTVNATTVSGDLVLDFAYWLCTGGHTLALVADASQTQLTTQTNEFESASCSSETASGTSTTMSWTISGAGVDTWGWGLFAFSVNAAASGVQYSYSNIGSRRNRPGIGPYSFGRYFRSGSLVSYTEVASGDPEGSHINGKLVNGGLLIHGVLI